MQTKMFVFVGIPRAKSFPTIGELQNRLESEFSSTGKSLQFTKKEQLLSARHNGVSYYVSILDSKKDLKHWIQMARDFEISSDLTSLIESRIDNRYNELRITKPGLYSEIEYSIVMIIFSTISKFESLDLMSFQ